MIGRPDPPRRIADLLNRFADAFSEWWLGFEGVVEADDPPDTSVPDDVSSLTDPDDT